jgi:acyl transferase domain-containing protein/acyl carrier protein
VNLGESKVVNTSNAGLRDEVAIIGIGCRYPGANGVDEFWRMLRDGVETITAYPGGRLPHIDSVYAAKDDIASVRGGFLTGIDRFDAAFFGISPREAALLDPQQRMLLEVAWEAIEDAGIPIEKMAASETGVFAGLWSGDYENCLQQHSDGLDFYATTGSGRYSASGRLAYVFDLRGPNLTVDTACSSSLVAVHLACRSLREGESEMALAGGANIILRPELTIAYSRARMLSPDGRSKFGDASVNGYVRSEGAGMILLKPLARAIADGDPIYAVIRGSAVNNDGRSSGMLVAPSREAQEAVLRRACKDAAIDPGVIDYIEAHGTGTPVGDPVEVGAIGQAIDTPVRQRACLLGSVKTNIGHTEAAAGAASIIKVALSLERATIPATLHLQQPNPSIPWHRLPVSLATATVPWPHTEPVRIAGVSGFGITGTNAHVVMQSFGGPEQTCAGNRSNFLFPLSARSEEALIEVAKSWLGRLESDSSWPATLSDLAYTAAVRRSHHDFRLAIVAASREELIARLTLWLSGQQTEMVRAGQQLTSRAYKTAFVFAGHGAQWIGMTRGLFEEAVFRETLAKCDESIRRFAGWSVIDQILSGEMPENASIAQPCLFAVMVALAALWRSWGIEPQAVVGHSMGECAAAVVSGALSLEDGAAVISLRSQLMNRVSGKGGMVFVALPLEGAAALAAEYGTRLSVAVSNSPGATVLSGDLDAIEDVMRLLNQREVFCRRVRVDVASHSSQMDPVLAELAQSLRDIQPQLGEVPIYSTTSGRIEDGTSLDSSYWCANLRHPVLFSGAMEQLLRDGFNCFLEISPHPLLVQPMEENCRAAGGQAIIAGSLRRDGNDSAEFLNSLGLLYTSGLPIDFTKLYPAGRCLRLPTYPWQRERHWIDTTSMHEPLRPIAVPSVSGSDKSSDLYELRWIETEPPQENSFCGLWIIVGADDERTSLFFNQMEALGNQCVRVDGVEGLTDTLETAPAKCRGVIRISQAEGADAREASKEAMDVVRTVRACAAATTPPRLLLVSANVWRIQGDAGEVCVAQSPAWGIGRIIEREHPELRPMNIDLSCGLDRNEVETLARLACGNAREAQLALRGRKIFAPRYERVQGQGEDAAPSFQANATYLITGGLGGVGLHLADWLVKKGARQIALVSRRAPDESARQRIARLESTGASLRIFSADTADQSQLRSVFETIRAELAPLKGVFHLAAVMEPALIGKMDGLGLERVMHSKAGTAWALHQNLDGCDLDFFVLFSSIAAAFGQPGLGSYAAANAYVEALGRYRRARELPGQSVQWGIWESTGLHDGGRQNGDHLYRQIGFNPASVETSLEALPRLMALKEKDVMAAWVDWDKFARGFEPSARPSAFERLLPIPAKADETPSSSASSLEEKLAKLDPDRRKDALERHLRETLAAVLKTAAQRIDPVKPFGAMGVDSLMALEFVRRLSAETTVRLPVTVVFNYPTIHLLAAEIGRRMDLYADVEQLPAASLVGVASSAVGDLTEEEAIEALMNKGGFS